MRLLLESAPIFDLPNTDAKPWDPVQDWPAFWISPPANWERPWVAAFSCEFVVESGARGSAAAAAMDGVTDRFHVTADERYELYLDGKLIGRGSDRGDQRIWYYDTYELTLTAGRHTLVARVWALGPALHPWAQISIDPGFFCCPENAELVAKVATGVGAWSVRRLDGYGFISQNAGAGTAMGVGPSERFDAAAIPWGWERGEDAPSEKHSEGEQSDVLRETARVRVGAGGNHGAEHYCTRPLHWLRPAALPAALSREWTRFRVLGEAGDWAKFLKGDAAMTLAPRTKHRVIVDLTDYVCAYPELRWSGGAGARIALGWAEALRDSTTGEKKRGSATESDLWVGESDEIVTDGEGGRWWRSLWWRCGCFVKLEIEVADKPLVLERLIIEETRYPFEPVTSWTDAVGAVNADEELAEVFSVCVRTLQMCMHETYMDCPYYEQLMYVGDTRIQCLLTYALGGDDRLARKSIELFDSSRMNVSGFTAAAHPNNGAQVIAPFSLWWIAMVHDYAAWRGEGNGFVKARLVGVRAVLERFLAHVGEGDGLMRSPAGWNFVDAAFPGGIPPGGLVGGVSAVFQLQFLMALQHAAELERAFGEPELAVRYQRREVSLTRVVLESFWDERRGLLADDLARSEFSDHAQCLAIIAGILTAEQEVRAFNAMLDLERAMTRATVYFSHYFFEVCFKLGRADVFFERLAPWRQCVREGCKTFPESFGRTRSDCHAWSAHPLFHYVTGVMGVRAKGISALRGRM